jgi:hypothetical protein
LSQRKNVFIVFLSVTINFIHPPLCTCSWYGKIPAAFVSVPEAAMDEYYQIMLFENEVRFAGQLGAMKPVSKAVRKKNVPDNLFWSCVLAFDSAHIVRANSWLVDVCHYIRNVIKVDSGT